MNQDWQAQTFSSIYRQQLHYKPLKMLVNSLTKSWVNFILVPLLPDWVRNTIITYHMILTTLASIYSFALWRLCPTPCPPRGGWGSGLAFGCKRAKSWCKLKWNNISLTLLRSDAYPWFPASQRRGAGDGSGHSIAEGLITEWLFTRFARIKMSFVSHHPQNVHVFAWQTKLFCIV